MEKLPIALNKAEILSEMESLVVLGGKDDTGKQDVYAIFSQCKPGGETNNYCDGAFCGNCVENCGGTKPPTTGSGFVTTP